MLKSSSLTTILFRRISTSKCALLTAQTQSDAKIQGFRTVQDDPTKHTPENIGQFYTLPAKDKSQLFLYGGLPKSFNIQTKTFNETCLMIRRPSLDVINCLKALDYSKPPVRFVLYGKKGCGRSLSLAHILHYCLKSGFLLVHVPWVGGWTRRRTEVSNSETREGFINLNLDAAAWLIHFKNQNEHLLKNPELKTSEEYVWTKRETTPKDVPLLELIDHGINRVKFASDCVLVLAEEIKRLSKRGLVKTLVAVDGYNAFFYPNTKIKTEKKETVHPHKITLIEAFLNLSKFDWNNAAVVVTVDELAIAPADHKSHMPRFLLGKDGFEHLDPFLPVFVDQYTTKELKSCMDYYRERKWVVPVQGQDEELAFISASNPYNLMQMCAAL